MRQLGYLLLTVGFLGGAYFSVYSSENVIQWPRFLPALALAVAGVVLARVALHRESTDESKVSGNIEAIVTSTDSLFRKITALDGEKESIDVYDLPARIDADFPEDLNTFVEARKSIGHLYGLDAYADVMNSFAAGERYLNRVWSCSVDGYVDEAQTYLGRCRDQFAEARDKLQKLTDGKRP
jgi:hypothetical protein